MVIELCFGTAFFIPKHLVITKYNISFILSNYSFKKINIMSLRPFQPYYIRYENAKGEEVTEQFKHIKKYLVLLDNNNRAYYTRLGAKWDTKVPIMASHNDEHVQYVFEPQPIELSAEEFFDLRCGGIVITQNGGKSPYSQVESDKYYIVRYKGESLKVWANRELNFTYLKTFMQ